MKSPEFPELFVEDGTDRYYLRGELRERPARFRTRAEAILMGRLAAHLGGWSDRAGGDALCDMGYRLRGDPPTAVGIPVSHIDHETAEADPADAWWITGPPRLAVEIVRHDEPAELLAERVAEYLACGVPLVWVFSPSSRSLLVHRPVVDPVALDARDTLDGGPEPPGFACPVADFFR